MSNAKLAVLCVMTAAGILSCTSRVAFPPPIASPANDWSLVLVQSGGFAGVNLTIQADSDGKITAKDARSGREITRPLSDSKLQELGALLAALDVRGDRGATSACADCFLYDLEITGPGGTTRWRGDDTTLDGSGTENLIRLLVKLRDEALSGAS
jgi:hypothetical protein